MTVLEVVKSLLMGFAAFSAVMLIGLYILFPTPFKLLWDAVNIKWAATSAKDIGAAIGRKFTVPKFVPKIGGRTIGFGATVGAGVEGFLLGLIAVWVLLKTGSMDKIKELGQSMSSGVPTTVARVICAILLPVTLAGTAIIAIVKLDPMFFYKAATGVCLFIATGKPFDVGELR